MSLDPPLALLLFATLCSGVNVRAFAQESTPREATGFALDAGPRAVARDASPQSVQNSDDAEQETPNEKKDKEEQKKKSEKKHSRRGSPVVAPLPISSPAIGSGVIPVLGYLFPFSTKDKVSPTSVVGVAGLFTNNGSRGFGVGGQFFLKEDTYEITAGFVHGNINYNIYGNGIAASLKLPIKQSRDGFKGEFLRRVGWKFFVGPRFMVGNSVITLRASSVNGVLIPPDLGFHTNLTAIGARLTRDTRPDHFYPISGTFFTFTSDFFSKTLNSKYSFQSYRTEFDKYWSLSKSQVIAYDGYFCATGGNPPFLGELHLWNQQSIARIYGGTILYSLHARNTSGVPPSSAEEVWASRIRRSWRSYPRGESIASGSTKWPLPDERWGWAEVRIK